MLEDQQSAGVSCDLMEVDAAAGSGSGAGVEKVETGERVSQKKKAQKGSKSATPKATPKKSKK